MRKILFTLMIVMLLACPAMAARYRQHQVVIVDEFGDPVTNIDQIEIFDVGTGDTSTIYSTRAGTLRTNPMTTTSGGFDPNLGLVQWFQAAPGYKITVMESDASLSLTIDNQAEGDTRFPFYANYIGSAASLTVGDDNLLNIGTSADYLHDWDAGNTRYVIYPASDGDPLHFGKATKHPDIYFHAGDITTDYIYFNQGSLQMSFVDIDLLIDDEAKLLFGDSGDITFDYDDSGDDLNITGSGLEVAFGADQAGMDVYIWGTTTGERFFWDESEDYLHVVGDRSLFTLTGTSASPFKVDVTGTVAGAAIQLETTNGGLTMQLDGSGNGDLVINVGDDYTNTVTGNWFSDVTGQAKLTSSSSSADSVLVTIDGGGSSTIKLYADEGTATDSIEFLTDGGGITGTATLGAVALSGIGGHTITSTAVANTVKGLTVSGTATTGCIITEGGGLYASFNSTQNAAGLLKAVGTWLDITAGTATAGNSMIALDVGIYQADSTPDMSLATAKVLNMEFQGSDTNGFSKVFWFNFNSSGQHPTAWFHCNGENNIAFTAETTHSDPNKLGAIAVQIDAINGGNLSYIYVYSNTGN